MSEIISVEHPTLKVSYEYMNRAFRCSHRKIHRQIDQIKKLSEELEKKLECVVPSKFEVIQFVDKILRQLQALKLIVDETMTVELFISNDLKTKLDHLKSTVSSENSTSNSEICAANLYQWKSIRVDRMVVDHLLRMGYFETAEFISNRMGICHLTNFEIFNASREIEDDLTMHSTAKCLRWCYENKTKLAKLHSNLEFRLHVQNFVELIRDNRCMDAVRYARKIFPAFVEANTEEIKHVMTLLLHNSKMDGIGQYEYMYNTERWNELLVMFRTENYRLLQLSKISMLSAAMHAGLSALKIKQCYIPNFRNPKCPVCQEEFNRIAESLPLAHYKQSRLICRITKLPINEQNPPMMLPNGQVFGLLGILKIRNRHGKIVCPITGNKFTKMDKIQKVFIV